MASSLNLTVQGQQSTETLNQSDDQIRLILDWYLLDKAGPMPAGLNPAQQNQWRVDTALDHIVSHVAAEAKRNRIALLQRGLQSVINQAQVETEL